MLENLLKSANLMHALETWMKPETLRHHAASQNVKFNISKY